MDKKQLEQEFFTRIPNARKINPVYRSIFELMYKAHLSARPGRRLLNIYASHDFSGNREEVYREKFFNECDYEAVDFWENKFVYNENKNIGAHTLPFPDKSFDVVVTTKFIMEHVSDPVKVTSEFKRVLKSGGELFLVAPLVRRQHQKPHDYFRFTEYGLEHLLKKAGFREVEIKPSNGCMATLASYAYFFQRGLNLPKPIERGFDFLHKWIIEPAAFFVDRFDNGYGRDMTLYFLVRAKT